jgi:hypothetical protein
LVILNYREDTLSKKKGNREDTIHLTIFASIAHMNRIIIKAPIAKYTMIFACIKHFSLPCALVYQNGAFTHMVFPLLITGHYKLHHCLLIWDAIRFDLISFRRKSSILYTYFKKSLTLYCRKFIFRKHLCNLKAHF